MTTQVRSARSAPHRERFEQGASAVDAGVKAQRYTIGADTDGTNHVPAGGDDRWGRQRTRTSTPTEAEGRFQSTPKSAPIEQWERGVGKGMKTERSGNGFESQVIDWLRIWEARSGNGKAMEGSRRPDP